MRLQFETHEDVPAVLIAVQMMPSRVGDANVDRLVGARRGRRYVDSGAAQSSSEASKRQMSKMRARHDCCWT